MKILLRFLTVSLLLIGARLPAAEPAAAPVSAAGVWQFKVETAQGTGSPVFTLKQDGENVTGQYKGALGEAPVTGTLKGSELKMSFTVSAQGQSLKIEYTGVIEGSKIKGTARFGDYGDGPFTGERSAN